MNTEKQFKMWKSLLIIGLILYPFLAGYFFLGSVVMESGGNDSSATSKIASLFQTLVVLSLFVSVVCFLTAKYFFDKGNLKKAILALRMPFIFGLLVVVVFFLH
jgi:hypothetical protein